MKLSEILAVGNSSYKKIFSFFKENALFCITLPTYLINFSMQYQSWNQLIILISIKMSHLIK